MRSKFLSILVVLFVVCMSLTLFSACNNDNKPDSSGAGSSISDSSGNGGGTTNSSGNATDSSSNGGGVTVYSVNLIVDGSVYAKISTKGNEIVNLPANPKKEGYVFDGWYWDNEVWKKPFTANSLLDTPLSSDMSVYAKWTAENHVATFKCDGKVVAEIFFTNESISIKEPEVVKKDGYTAKWEEYELGTKDITINAVYTPIRYTIKYIDGLGVKNDNPDSYTIESDDIVLKELFYDGVKFEGWYLNGEKIEKIAKGTFGNLELTAVWENREYKIEYELNGGKNNTANPISYTVDSNLIILQTPSKLGFDFKGWFTEVDFKSQVYAIPTGSMGDKKFYAKWQAIVYTIEYELNGGENNSQNPSTYTIESEDIVLQAPSKTGYDFVGWYTDEALTKKIEEITTGSYDDKKFYAKWTPTIYRIEYELSGGENNVQNPITYTIESEDIVLQAPSKTDYDFVGWYQTVDFSDKIITSIPLGSYGNKTLYAKWTPIVYDIEYELNGGENNSKNPSIYTIESEDIVLRTPSKTGYDFVGWYTDESLTKSIEKIATGSYGNKKFYVKWTPTVYNIEYELNGGENNAQNPSTYTIESEDIVLQTPSRTGCIFDCWCEDEALKEKIEKIATGSYGNKKVYTKWTPIVYSIKYELNGGENNSQNQTTYTVESEDIFLQAPSKTDYDFVGWYQTADFSDRIITNISLGSYGNKTLYAKWESKYFLFSDGTITGLTDYGKNCEKIVVPEKLYDITVTSIGDSAFYNHSSLTSVTISNSVTSIARKAFYNCSRLTSVAIPDSVTSIGSYAFSNCSSLTSVVIPNSVTAIGSSAFSNCRSLASVTIPDSVTSIGDYAFSGCDSLKYNEYDNAYYLGNDTNKYVVLIKAKSKDITSCEINDNCKFIHSNAFSDCSSLTSITISDDITTIGRSAFSGCSSLASITIPNSVTTIDSYAFRGCSSLTSVTIPDGVTTIGYSAFENCSSLTSVIWNAENCTSAGSVNCPIFKDCNNLTTIIIGAEVKIIPSSVFSGCDKLTSVTIPDSVTSIGGSAFSGCSSLVSITIPNSVVSIGGSAFKGCSSLTSVIWNAENCTSAGSSDYPIFKDCNNLTTVTIGAEVKTIPTYTFYSGLGITSVIWNAKNFMNNNGLSNHPTFEDCNKLTTITIGDEVKIIPSSVFSDCISVTRVTIGNSVTTIGAYAFCGCSSLTSVTIGNGVTSIGNYAFENCSSLTNIYITDLTAWCNISGFDNLMYYGSSNKKLLYLNNELITELVIPNGVTTIPSFAFFNCGNFTSIIIPDSVTSIGSSVFSGFGSLKYNEYDNAYYLGNDTNKYVVLIKAKSKDITSCEINEKCKFIYQMAFNDCSSLTSVKIPNSVTSIGDNAFNDCSSLISVTIPNSVTSIGYQSFAFCDSLTSITIPNSVTSIDSCAFIGCRRLSSVTIPNSVTSIGYSAFDGCNSLKYNEYDNAYYLGNDTNKYVVLIKAKSNDITSCKINDNCKLICSGAFENCSSLVSVTIPDSVTSIDSLAFKGCSNLTNVTIGSRVTNIGSFAFENCSSLTSVTIPNSVTTIGYSAFKNCSKLKTIYYKGSESQWNEIEKGGFWNYGMSNKYTVVYDAQ